MSKFYALLTALVALALVLAGCPQQTQPDETPVETPEEEEVEEEEEDEPQIGMLGMVAVAQMVTGDGEQIGEVTFTQTAEGVQVEGQISGLEAGTRGFHVHEYGECEPPDFMSAGGHFNPQGHPHGGPDDPHGERHAGDFGNIEVEEDGTATFSFVDEMITLGSGENDVLGHALIIHEEEDDLETQPTGDAGGRAACGIIEVVQ